jgi:hypothetical protein
MGLISPASLALKRHWTPSRKKTTVSMMMEQLHNPPTPTSSGSPCKVHCHSKSEEARPLFRLFSEPLPLVVRSYERRSS